MTAVVLVPIARRRPGPVRRAAPPRWPLLVGGLCLLGRAAAARLPGRPAVQARPGRLHGRRRRHHDRRPAGEDHRRPGRRRRVRPRRSRRSLSHLDDVHWPTAACSAAAAGRRCSPSTRLCPAAARTADRRAAGGRGRGAASLQDHGIAVVGPVPAGLPTPQLPDLRLADLRAAARCRRSASRSSAYTDNVLTGAGVRPRAGQTGSTPTRNCWRSASATSRPAWLQGFPVSSSGSRTAIGDALGSRTQLYSLVAVAMRRCRPCCFPGRCWRRSRRRRSARWSSSRRSRLIDVGELRRIARFRRSELLLAARHHRRRAGRSACSTACWSPWRCRSLDLLRRVARPHDGILGLRAGRRRHARRRRLPDARQVPGPGRLPLRLAAVLRQRRGLPQPGAGSRSTAAGAGASSGSCSTPRPTSRVDITAVDALDDLRTSCTTAASSSRWPG